MMSLTELARLEEFCCSRVEWRIDTIWSADCRVRGSSTPVKMKHTEYRCSGLVETINYLESEVP